MKAGTMVYLRAVIYDNVQVPPALFDPSVGVAITLKNPDGTTKAGGSMTRVSTGIYFYRHQSAAGDQKGLYTADVTATDAAGVAIETYGAFTLDP